MTIRMNMRKYNRKQVIDHKGIIMQYDKLTFKELRRRGLSRILLGEIRPYVENIDMKSLVSIENPGILSILDDESMMTDIEYDDQDRILTKTLWRTLNCKVLHRFEYIGPKCIETVTKIYNGKFNLDRLLCIRVFNKWGFPMSEHEYKDEPDQMDGNLIRTTMYTYYSGGKRSCPSNCTKLVHDVRSDKVSKVLIDFGSMMGRTQVSVMSDYTKMCDHNGSPVPTEYFYHYSSFTNLHEGINVHIWDDNPNEVLPQTYSFKADGTISEIRWSHGGCTKLHFKD